MHAQQPFCGSQVHQSKCSVSKDSQMSFYLMVQSSRISLDSESLCYKVN